MAIEAILGLIGGGKSYSCVRRMCAYMAQGGRCCSNILLEGWDIAAGCFAPDSPVLAYLVTLGWNYQPGQYTYISFEDMVSSGDWFKRVPGGVSRRERTLLVVDEATDLFDNLDRDKVRTDSSYRELFRFLRLSRHAHVDVLFICQDIASVNSRLRGLVGGFWRSTDMGAFKLFGLPLPSNRFLLQRYDRTGKIRQFRTWLTKQPSLFKCYKSEAFADDLGISFDGVAIDKRAGRIAVNNKGVPMWAKIASCLALLISFATLFVACRSTSGTVHNSGGGVVTNVVQQVVSAPVVAPAVQHVLGDYAYALLPRSGPIFSFWGRSYQRGSFTRWGIVELITPEAAVCVDQAAGAKTILMRDGRPEENEIPSQL